MCVQMNPDRIERLACFPHFPTRLVSHVVAYELFILIEKLFNKKKLLIKPSIEMELEQCPQYSLEPKLPNLNPSRMNF